MQRVPVENRVVTQPFIAGGCLIKKDDRFLLVQEGVAEKGSWNHPAGWIDLYENIIDGAKREAEEETGLKVKIVGFLGAYSLIKRSPRTGRTVHAVKFIFAAEPLTENIILDPEEIMDARWFTLEEIKKLKADGVLRDHDIIDAVQHYLDGKIFDPVPISYYREQL